MNYIKKFIYSTLITGLAVFFVLNPVFAIENTQPAKKPVIKTGVKTDKNADKKEQKQKKEKRSKKEKQPRLNKKDRETLQKIHLDKNVNKKLVTKIDYDDIWEKAKEHSYDLKIADFNILISKQDIRGARSEYFPKLILAAGTEYTKNYRDNRDTTVMSIGESFINPYTRYQSIMGITLTYNLFDFGVRKGTLDAAKEDVVLKELEQQEKMQDLNLNIIDTYSKILITGKQIELNKKILALEKNTLAAKERLFNAGELSKTELSDEKVKVENTEKKINELYSIMGESISWLEFYTGDTYRIDDLKVGDLKKPDFDVTEYSDYTQSVKWKIKEHELKKKEFEIKVAKRTNYPKVNAYGRYYIYGSNPSSYNDSLGDIRPSNFTVGASVNMLAFDGLKNRSNIQKKILEYKQLQVERDKSIAELMMKLASMRSNLLYLDKQIENNKKIIKELVDKQKSVNRLAAKKLATPMDVNDVNIELLEQEIEYTKNSITSTAITKGIQVLTTY